MADVNLEEGAVDTNARASVDSEEKRYCWVCFASEDDEPALPWVQPCNCKGTTKWVHQMCLQRWVDEKQKGNTAGKVCCPQCNSEYIIFFPNMGPLVEFLDCIDNVIYKVCPFVAAGIVVGAIYWTAATYGAITVMQVVGHKEGVASMETADPLALLVGLPMIPVALILGKMVRWEDTLLIFLRKHSRKIPILRHVLPSYVEGDRHVVPAEIPHFTDPVSATRVLCSALLLPTVATICGKLMFDNLPTNFQRTCMGGLAFLAVKGFLKIYQKQQDYVRQSRRKILDNIPNATGIPAPPRPGSPQPQ